MFSDLKGERKFFWIKKIRGGRGDPSSPERIAHTGSQAAMGPKRDQYQDGGAKEQVGVMWSKMKRGGLASHVNRRGASKDDLFSEGRLKKRLKGKKKD